MAPISAQMPFGRSFSATIGNSAPDIRLRQRCRSTAAVRSTGLASSGSTITAMGRPSSISVSPGHTPGHTSLQLMMPETGPVLLTGDLYHRAESRELKRVPRFNSDEAMTVSSMEAFEARADALGAKVIIQHEPADIDPLEGKIR